MTRQELLNSFGKSSRKKFRTKTEFRGETTYTIAADDLREIAKFCRDEVSFDYLLDITSIDNFGEEPRFEIVYELYSMPHAAHLRLKLRISEDVGASRYRFRYLADSELARARNLRHDGNQVQRTPRSAADLNVGRLSLLSASERLSPRGIAERNARCRFHESHVNGRWTVRYKAEHSHGKRSRAARASAAIVNREARV